MKSSTQVISKLTYQYQKPRKNWLVKRDYLFRKHSVYNTVRLMTKK